MAHYTHPGCTAAPSYFAIDDDLTLHVFDGIKLRNAWVKAHPESKKLAASVAKSSTHNATTFHGGGPLYGKRPADWFKTSISKLADWLEEEREVMVEQPQDPEHLDELTFTWR